MLLDDYFHRGEFVCPCGCGFDTVDAELLKILKDVRVFFDKPVVIYSGCRCIVHNTKVDGAFDSQHLRGRAADFIVVDVPVKDVQRYVLDKYPDRYGIGTYQTFTHIDSRTVGPARW